MNPLPATGVPKLIRFDAAGVADGEGVSAAPGSLIIAIDDDEARPLFAGPTGEADRHEAAGDAVRFSLPGSVLLPALVNAHCHLDLTHVGPRPYRPQDGFVSWIRMVMGSRVRDDGAIRASVREGIARSLAGGVTAVGDIAACGSLAPLEELGRAEVGGVSYEEVFGMGAGERGGGVEAARWAIRSAGERARGARLGVSPHAPYTAGPGVFRAGHVRGAMAAAHVSESVEEIEFVARGTGPFRTFLEQLGVWDSSVLEWAGRGAHPVDVALDAIGESAGSRWLFAHVNAAEDRHIERLAARGVGVAFCPRAHSYFGQPGFIGRHRWREMIECGVLVCLGTDSVINLAPGATSARITPLDDARHLWREGGCDARVLLRMITSNPARALELAPAFDFGGGAVGGMIGVDVGAIEDGEDPATAVMRSLGGARWILRGGTLHGFGDEACAR